MAWLVNGSNTGSLAWADDNSGPSGTNQKATTASFPSSVSDQSIGGYTVAVSLWRNSATPTILEVSAAAAGDANATIRQRIRLGTTTVTTSTPNSLNLFSNAPIVVNGGLSGITGTPDVYPNTDGGVAIATSSSETATGESAIDTGHLNLHGGTVSYNAFSGSAWDYIFTIKNEDGTSRLVTKEMIKAESERQALLSTPRTIFYYPGSFTAMPWEISPWSADKVVGSSDNPVAIVFDQGAGCPKINGGETIYGVIYYYDDCGKEGWGGATVYGSLIAEQNITKLTANTEIMGWSVKGSSGVVTLPPTITNTTAQTFAKLAASWRDF